MRGRAQMCLEELGPAWAEEVLAAGRLLSWPLTLRDSSVRIRCKSETGPFLFAARAGNGVLAKE
jgi:hypothetical protein